jgi:hypothetical protein
VAAQYWDLRKHLLLALGHAPGAALVALQVLNGSEMYAQRKDN